MAMIVCVLLPRFELTTALGERGELLQSPVALAPEPGGSQQVGEVSLAAEAFGIHSGMRLGEALARCPSSDARPARSGRRRRQLGAAAGRGSSRSARRSSRSARDSPALTLAACSGCTGGSRACSRSPAGHCAFPPGSGSRRLASRRLLRQRERGCAGLRSSRSRQPAAREQAAASAGERSARRGPRARTRLPRVTAGHPPTRPPRARGPARGARTARSCNARRARRAARRRARRSLRQGGSARPRARSRRRQRAQPRPASEFLREVLELPDATSGTQLQRGLELLIDRLLARRERRGRTFRSVVISAKLVEQGGTWREQHRVPRGAV